MAVEVDPETCALIEKPRPPTTAGFTISSRGIATVTAAATEGSSEPPGTESPKTPESPPTLESALPPTSTAMPESVKSSPSGTEATSSGLRGRGPRDRTATLVRSTMIGAPSLATTTAPRCSDRKSPSRTSSREPAGKASCSTPSTGVQLSVLTPSVPSVLLLLPVAGSNSTWYIETVASSFVGFSMDTTSSAVALVAASARVHLFDKMRTPRVEATPRRKVDSAITFRPTTNSWSVGDDTATL